MTLTRNVIRYTVLTILILVLYVSCSQWDRRAMTRPYPEVEGELQLAGLQERVIVQRDEWGVPHIYAQNLPDLFLAQGYVHAQDRFWQMEFWRHISLGRISEIVGEAGVEDDKFIRTVGWNRTAQQTVDYYAEENPEYLALMEAYAAGVNAYMAQQEGNVSFNYQMMQLLQSNWELEPWEPIHSFGWGIVMSHDLSGNYKGELERAEMVERFGADFVEQLYPAYPADWPVVVPSEETAGNPAQQANAAWLEAVAWEELSANLVAEAPENGFAFGAEPFVGSNNWVIAGDHTENGMPLLANDPHLAIQMPAIWYEVGLHAPGLDAVGFSFAGVPGVIIGHNDQIAWGVTNLGPDVQDLFVEKVNPDNPFEYEFEGEMREMDVLTELIEVNGQRRPIELTVRSTHHGPIISDIMEDEELVLAMQWTANRPSRILEAVMDLNRAQNYDEFRAALSVWDVPGQNFVYADKEGNIGYQGTGLVPIRAGGGRGLYPVPGWTGEHEWLGFIPYDEMPRVFNPPSGYIMTANHAIVDENYPYFVEHSWANGDRARRLETLLQEAVGAGGVSAADIAEMQVDSYSLTAEDWVPVILASQAKSSQWSAGMLNRLADWDYQMRRDSSAASIFDLFYWFLIQNTLSDELGEEGSDLYLGHGMSTRVLMQNLASDETAVLWDDVTTKDKVETRDDIVSQSLDDAINWLNDAYGNDPADWAWGKLHQATFTSAPLGLSGVGYLEARVNRGPFPVDGGEGIVNATGWRWDDPATVNWHPSMRMIVDLSDFDQSLAVLPTGQSGHPGHAHYDDMVGLWIEGELHPMWYSREAVDAATEATMVLLPVAVPVVEEESP